MRSIPRLILGIAVFIAAAGVVSAQQPDPQPSLPPIPEMQVTPAPQPPDVVPATEQTSTTRVLELVPIVPDKPALARPAKRVSASRKPIEKPATSASSSQAKEAAAAASMTVTADSSSLPPPGGAIVPASAASPVLPQTAPTAVDPVVQAEMDKKLADAAQRKKNVGGRILIGVGVLALIGLAVFFVRSRGNSNTLPPIFDGGPARAGVVSVAAVRSGPAR